MYFHKIVAVIGALFAINLARAEEAKVINFSNDNSLKSVFDSGLRPYRALGLETVRLRLDDTVTGVILPKGVTLKEMRWETIKLTVIKPGLVSSMEFRSGPLSVESAKAAVLEFAGNETNRLKLEEFLSRVSKQPLLLEGEFDLSLGDELNPTRSISLSRRGVPGKPLAMNLYLVWKSDPPEGGSKFYSEPIPPPPGYENVPMDDRRYPGLTAGNSVPPVVKSPAQKTVEMEAFPKPDGVDFEKTALSNGSSVERRSIFVVFVVLVIGLIYFVLSRRVNSGSKR